MSRPARIAVIVSVLLVAITFLAVVRKVIADFNRSEQLYAECPQGSECRHLAELFASDYSESKDLAKSFLTLLVAVFVSSITFSEKIVDFTKSGGWPKAAMIGCWLALLVAIAASGTGVGYMVVAYGIAVYTPEFNYAFLEARAVQLFIASGILFGFGLCAMLLGGLSTALRTLPEPVSPVGCSARESDSILKEEAKAIEVAGSGNVSNMIEVKVDKAVR
jgi:hypothetical protein